MMTDGQLNYLRSVLAVVTQDLGPAASTDFARLRADLVRFVLSRMIAEESAPAEVDGAYRKKLARLFNAAETGPEGVAHQIAALREAVMNGLVSPSQRELLRKSIGDLAEAEVARRDRIEALVNDEQDNAKIIDAAKAATGMTEETVTDYLRARFPEQPGIRAVNVRPIPGGRSKGTTLAVMTGSDAPEREIVLRQDLGIEVAGQAVTYEYPIIRAMWDAGLAVPEPLWLEPGDNSLGGAFIAFGKVEGKPGGTLFDMTAPADAARDLAAFFGQLHSVDIDAVNLREHMMWGALGNPVKALLDLQYGHWKASELNASPLIEAAFLWLYDQLDVVTDRPVIVHGDSSFHNILIHEGRMTAMLDWEFAHAGDPAEDLMGCQHFVTQVMPWDEFLDIYRDNGGLEIADARQDFFSLWRSLRFAIATARASSAFERGKSKDLRLAAIGYNSHPKLLHDVAHQLARITRSDRKQARSA